MTKEHVAALLDDLDGPLLVGWWEVRRWDVRRAIERHACDLTAIEQLMAVLGGDLQEPDEWQYIQEARRTMELLDALMLRERVRSTGLLLSPALVKSLSAVLLSLEVRFPPDARGWFSEQRMKLTRMAECREIDLRGLDV